MYPNLVLINCYWHKYIIPRGLFGSFEDNKFSHIIASVEIIIMTLHIKVIELKEENRKLKILKRYKIRISYRFK